MTRAAQPLEHQQSHRTDAWNHLCMVTVSNTLHTMHTPHSDTLSPHPTHYARFHLPHSPPPAPSLAATTTPQRPSLLPTALPRLQPPACPRGRGLRARGLRVIVVQEGGRAAPGPWSLRRDASSKLRSARRGACWAARRILGVVVPASGRAGGPARVAPQGALPEVAAAARVGWAWVGSAGVVAGKKRPRPGRRQRWRRTEPGVAGPARRRGLRC